MSKNANDSKGNTITRRIGARKCSYNVILSLDINVSWKNKDDSHIKH